MTVKDFIAYAGSLGLDGVELGYYWDDEANELASVPAWLKDAKLALSGYIVSNNFAFPDVDRRAEEVKKVKHAVDNAQRLGAGVLRIFGGSGGLDVTFDEAREYAVDCFRECNEYAAPRGVRLALEDHGGIAANSEHLLYYESEVDSPNFGFMVDIGNFRSTGGEDPLDGVRRTAHKAFQVHLKDVKEDAGGAWQACVLGEGNVPLKECLQALEDAGFDGYLSLEYEAPDAVKDGIERSLEYLRRFDWF
jgi:sugar phosphate isomerase/epimerase